MIRWSTGAPDGRGLLADDRHAALFDEPGLAAHVADLLALTPPPTLTLSAVPGDGTVTLDWNRVAASAAGWKVERDGVDDQGGGPWSTTIPADALPFVMRSLVNGREYGFTLTDLATGEAATARATPTGTPPPPKPAPPTKPTPATGDGPQAAVLLSWGPPLQVSDEFEDTWLDLSKWGPYNGKGHNGNGRRVPSAFSVAGGILTCRGLANGDSGGMYHKAWSGKTYRSEVRARAAQSDGATTGAQYHPVILWWKDDSLYGWPFGGEDDFPEWNVGDAAVQAFIHHPRQNDGSKQSSARWKGDPTVWHNYALERSTTAVTGWVDGVQLFRVTDPAALAVPGPMHLCVQLDNFGGNPHRPADLQVAWARIYAPPK